ncbi:MAG TPA: PP2C family serine/threonine-protein phosphatase [Longimicrobiales bacterium]|nr:PP2C family serine/threonine-protein phosphatase [Longimicrobiales bacterium]
MILHSFALSDVGRVRTRNEDAFVVRSDIGLFAVADGMGGHAAGDVASKTAVDALANAMTISNDESLIHHAVQLANIAVWERGQHEPDKAGMGTTLTAAVFSEDRDHVTIGHVGDSRCYLLRAGKLERLTQDHSIGANLLTRAIGTRPDVDVDIEAAGVKAGDIFLICSDGLHGIIDDAHLHAILKQEKPIQEIANDLIESANLRGGPDNITALLIKAV